MRFRYHPPPCPQLCSRKIQGLWGRKLGLDPQLCCGLALWSSQVLTLLVVFISLVPSNSGTWICMACFCWAGPEAGIGVKDTLLLTLGFVLPNPRPLSTQRSLQLASCGSNNRRAAFSFPSLTSPSKHSRGGQNKQDLHDPARKSRTKEGFFYQLFPFVRR